MHWSKPTSTVYKNAYLGVGQNFDIWEYSSHYLDAGSLIRFAPPTTVNGKEIISAELHLSVQDLPADRNTTYRCGAVARSWNTNTVTYNNHPDDAIYSDYRVDFRPPYTGGVPVKIDITNIVSRWASGNWANYGLLLWDTNGQYPSTTAHRANSFYEESNGSNAPTLKITYQP